MALREEAFLLTSNIESISGLSYGVNRPAKSGSNPIWPSLSGSGSVPDWGVGYISTRVNGATTELFTTCFDGPNINTVHLGSPETTDGTTITRPTRGLITFNGNTTNNLITPGGYTRNQFRVTWDSVTSKYKCFAYWNNGSNFYIDLFEATSPQTTGWGSYVQRISAPLGAGVASAQACEPTALFRRADGRWCLYIQTSQGGTADYQGARRHLGMLLGPSDNTLVGTWTSVGAGANNEILTSPSGSEQYYHSGGWVDGDLVYVPIGIFDGSAAPPGGHAFSGTVNRIHKVQLFVGRASDPTTLTLADGSWLSSTGVEGAWEGGEIIGANNVAEVGNEWRYYYAGDADTHHQSPELSRLMGVASIGRRQIGRVTGTGSVTLAAITPGASGGMSVTVIAESGTVKLELLNSSTGAVLTGYSQTDCDAITADGTEQTVTWRGSHVAPADAKIKAYVTSGELNYVSATTITGGLKLDTAGDTAWTQGATGASIGRQITVYTARGVRDSVGMSVYSAAGGRVRVQGTDASKWEVSLDGSSWAQSQVVSAGRTDMYLSVTPSSSDAALSCDIGVSP